MKPKLLLLMFLLTLNLLAGRSAKGQTETVADPQIPKGPCVVISGAVSRPASVVFTKPIRLADLISSAGGPTDKAGDTVQILHSRMRECWQDPPSASCSEVTLSFNLYHLYEMRNGDSYNPVIHPGDVVIVQEAPLAYVIGNVLLPQGIHFREQLTVAQAITLAGGSMPGSKLDRVRVIRPQNASGVSEEIVVNLKKVKKGLPDLTLQPYDIVEVPGKPGKRGDLLCVLRIGSGKIPLVSNSPSEIK
jgi:polysaccharide export outer membrane protein